MGFLILAGPSTTPNTTGVTLTEWTNVESGAWRGFALEPNLLSGYVSFSGTYTGETPTAMQGRIKKVEDNSVVVDWTTLTGSAPSAGVFSGKMLAPPCNLSTTYYREVRPLGLPGITDSATVPCAVGTCSAFYGQSQNENMTNATGSPSVAGSSNAGTCWYDRVLDVWCPAYGATNGYRVVNFYMNEMAAITGIASFGFSRAKAAASAGELKYGAQAAPYDWCEQLIATAQYIGNINVILEQQGEGDTPGDTQEGIWFDTKSRLTHEPICTALGRTPSQIPWLLASLATFSPPPDNVSGYGTARINRKMQAASRVADYATGFFYSHSNRDAYLYMQAPHPSHPPGTPAGDGLHMSAETNKECARRFAYSAAYRLGYTSQPPYLFITSAVAIDSTHTDVTLQHYLGTDFTPTGANQIKNFIMSDNNWATQVDCTGSRVNATTIRLTHSALGATRKLRHSFYAYEDTTNYVRDNSALNVPLNFTPREDIAVTPASGTRKPQPCWLHNYRSDTWSYLQPSVDGVETLTAVRPYIGAANADRHIIMMYSTEAAVTLVSFTIRKAGFADIVATTNKWGTSRCGGGVIVAVPAAYGTICDSMEVKLSGTLSNAPSFSIWSVRGDEISSLTALDTDGLLSTVSATPSVDITTGSNGFIMATAQAVAINGAPSFFDGGEAFAMGYDFETTDYYDTGIKRVAISIASPAKITWTAHGRIADAPVAFSVGITLPTGLVAGTTYYVRNPTTNDFEVSATAGGASINTSGSQLGFQSAYDPTLPATITVSIASPAKVTWIGHKRAANCPITFVVGSPSATLPTGLNFGVTYYVRNPTANDFEVSATSGGSSINTSGSQTGTLSAVDIWQPMGPTSNGSFAEIYGCAVGNSVATNTNTVRANFPEGPSPSIGIGISAASFGAV